MLRRPTLLLSLSLLAEAYSLELGRAPGSISTVTPFAPPCPHAASRTAHTICLSASASARASSARASSSALSTLVNVADEYSALFLDQFGVIHDGKTAYEGAVDAVRTLQQRGVRIVIISNSSRRRSDTIARLRAMGFGPVAEDGEDAPELPPIAVVTSGELVWKGLAASDKGDKGDKGDKDEPSFEEPSFEEPSAASRPSAASLESDAVSRQVSHHWFFPTPFPHGAHSPISPYT